VAIGVNAGQGTQGASAVAIGANAGQDSQQANAVAIGNGAGRTGQQTNAVAIGNSAGLRGQQAGAVAIGVQAGYTSQSLNAIAIGSFAGMTNQGQYAIAIGYQAGLTQQANNSIVLNAMATPLNSTTNGMFVDPIRSGTSTQVLYYDTLTKEITYSLAGGVSSYATLTDGPTITWNLTATVNNARVTLGGARTLAITGAVDGMSGTLIVTQDVSGGRTLALPATSRVVNNGGGAVSLSVSGGSIDVLTFVYANVVFYWTYGNNFT
jgi:hypothetical protein